MGMNRTSIVITVFLILFLSRASLLLAGESCSMMSGLCRDACSHDEEAAIGAFDDCGEKQSCCLVHTVPQVQQINCCVVSFEAAQFGPLNCSVPENNNCQTGSGNPASCETLEMCK